MVKRNKFKKNFKQKYIPGEYSIRERADAGIPVKALNSGDSMLLNRSSFRDLSYAKPITVEANPTAEATRSAVPYAIINSTNQVWEADYPGVNNMAGNTLPLLNNSADSKLLNAFDCGKVDLVLKYLYAAIKPTDINQALNVQLGKSMSEALSKAYSETYIQMPLFQDKITSSMINCDTLNRTQVFIWYQTMLQNIASIPAKYNLLISLEQHLKDSCYNRNVAPLDELFGQLRKNSFRAKITAFSNIVTGEYFDMSWFKQINTLTMVPSRKSNSIRDPLLVIDATHDVPDLKITTDSGTVVLDSANYKVTMPKNFGTPNDGKQVSFREAVQTLIQLLSPYNVLAFCRQYTEKIVSQNPTDYFNKIDKMIELIRSALSKFPSDVSDIRTVLDVANRAGLNRWVRGVYFDITKEMNYQPVFNKLCNDVFVNYLASPNTIYYDNVTYRWKFYTLWDEFLGIPKYDKVNGGSFLSFSTRQFESSVTPSTDTKYLVPKLFDISNSDYNPVDVVNRKGITAKIKYTVYNADQIENSPIYCRLNTLKYSDYDQRIPTVDVSTGYANIPDVASSLYRMMTSLFSIGNVKVNENVTNETVDSDIVSIVDVELDDVSNAMIAFAQAYAPFKVYTPVTERTIGFKETPSVIR